MKDNLKKSIEEELSDIKNCIYKYGEACRGNNEYAMADWSVTLDCKFDDLLTLIQQAQREAKVEVLEKTKSIIYSHTDYKSNPARYNIINDLDGFISDLKEESLSSKDKV